MIVAGAGGAAHLPGMVAAATPLPVIGVPVPLQVLDGLDSLLSIVQMPAGVPVATVAVGGARNAGLLAVRILAAARLRRCGRGWRRSRPSWRRRCWRRTRRCASARRPDAELTEFPWRGRAARRDVAVGYTGEEVVLRCIASGLVRWLSASTTGR